MEFRVYEKIHRLGKEETDGYLLGTISVQEKVDGANTSIWLKDGEIRCGSRNNDVTEGSFNGFVEYAKNHEGIKRFFERNPEWRLYGEWLVRHTIAYNETAYKKFYLFDILMGEDGDGKPMYMDANQVRVMAETYDIPSVPFLGKFTNPTLEQLTKLVGKSEFGDRGEGVVLKNPNFVNKFGDFCYAKMVTQQFKEDNAIVFGGNNKHSDTYWEMYVVNKYVTLPRVKKVMDKIQPTIDERIDMKHIPMICSSVYHDLITEEAWDIVNKVQSLNFFKLKSLVNKKAKQVFVDILNDSISVADQ